MNSANVNDLENLHNTDTSPVFPQPYSKLRSLCLIILGYFVKGDVNGMWLPQAVHYTKHSILFTTCNSH